MKRQGIYAIMHLFVIRLFKRTQFFQNVFLNRYNFLPCMWVFNIGTQNLFCKHYFPYGLSISFKLFWKLFHTILASYTKVIFEIFEIVMYLSKIFCSLALLLIVKSLVMSILKKILRIIFLTLKFYVLFFLHFERTVFKVFVLHQQVNSFILSNVRKRIISFVWDTDMWE